MPDRVLERGERGLDVAELEARLGALARDLPHVREQVGDVARAHGCSQLTVERLDPATRHLLPSRRYRAISSVA